MKSFGFIFASFLTITAYAIERPPQYVMLAFDGSKSSYMWEATMDFASQENIKFTYFISGVYFLTNADKKSYKTPTGRLGRSNIGFGGETEDVINRYAHILRAIDDGHEIASHANGHFDGSQWTAEQWLNEFLQFTSLILNGYQAYNQIQPPLRLTSYINNNIKGFRAPLLGHGSGLYQTLSVQGFSYDTSKIRKMSYWPKLKNNVWDFPLAGLRLSRSGKKTASMDYNLYLAQSGAKRAADEKLQGLEDEVVETYMNYFNYNYYGNRAPVDIGHHFSLWNRGIYWNAMKRLARKVCKKPEVVCGTYTELVNFLNSKTVLEIEDYQAGNFPKYNKPASGLSLNSSDAVSKNFTSLKSLTTELTEEELSLLKGDMPEAHQD